MLQFIPFYSSNSPTHLLDLPSKWAFAFQDLKSKQRTSGFSLIESEAEDRAACPFISLI